MILSTNWKTKDGSDDHLALCLLSYCVHCPGMQWIWERQLQVLPEYHVTSFVVGTNSHIIGNANSHLGWWIFSTGSLCPTNMGKRPFAQFADLWWWMKLLFLWRPTITPINSNGLIGAPFSAALSWVGPKVGGIS